jgi:glycosyltransferase involved in cell wall biosynthesis
MQKIRVALLTYAIDGRRAKGTAIVARKSVEHVIAHSSEFEVSLLHFEKSNEEIYSAGAREVVFPKFRWSILNKRSIRMLYYFLSTKDQYDVMHWFQPRVYPFFFLAPTRHTIATLHGAGDVTENALRCIPSRTVFIWTLRYLGKFLSAVIAGSEYAKRDIVRLYGFSPEYVHVINNGADEAFAPQDETSIAAVKVKYALPQKYFLNIARLIPSKNVIRTLRAFEIFCRENQKSDMYFVHVGIAGPDRAAVDSLIEASPYRERILLVGYVDQQDLAALYASAYALVFPILNEGFGLPAVEAMACGTPVVISDTAAPEMTPDDAYLVDALDEQSIARAMSDLANNEALRKKLQTGGRKKAAEFTWEKSGERIIALYRRIVTV